MRNDLTHLTGAHFSYNLPLSVLAQSAFGISQFLFQFNTIIFLSLKICFQTLGKSRACREFFFQSIKHKTLFSSGTAITSLWTDSNHYKVIFFYKFWMHKLGMNASEKTSGDCFLRDLHVTLLSKSLYYHSSSSSLHIRTF